MIETIDIHQFKGTTITVYVNSRRHWTEREYRNVTRSSFIRAQRMQLKLFDAVKGQSPDDSQGA